MLTVSFLLSSLTVIQNSKEAEIAGSNSVQNTASVLLIDSMPQPCENKSLEENETCLRINTRSARNDVEVGTENSVAMDTSDKLRRKVTTLAITIPESGTRGQLGEKITTTVVEDNESEVSKTLTDPLEKASRLACQMITRELLGEVGNSTLEEKTTSSNSICIELYRDNGDTIANSDDDQFIGFSLVMGDSGHNPQHSQYSHLAPGTYFAKIYSMVDLSVAPGLDNRSIASEISAESEN